MVKPKCIVVALEGLDAAGKTTAAVALRRALARAGVAVIVRHAEKHYLRSAFRFAREQGDPGFKYLLQSCAAQMLSLEIAAAPKNTVFICDRYFASAKAYYLARCGDPDLLNPAADLLPPPDIPVFLECSARVRKARLRGMSQRPSARKMRAMNPEFSARMREIIVRTYPWVRIDTERTSRKETIVRIFDLVMEVLSK